MSGFSQVDERWQRLFESAADGTIRPEESKQLSDHLNGSEAARIAFHDFITLEVQLELEYAEAAPQPLRGLPLRDTEQEDELLYESSTRSERIWWAIRDRASNFVTLSLVISALFITNILLSLALIVPDWGNQNTAEPELSSRFVAVVTSASDAKWLSAQPSFREGPHDLRVGEWLELASGVATVTFDSGAQVLLQGPTRFVGLTSNSGRLERGRLTALVPRRAIGFAVTTPTAVIEDLGTEFVVEVDDDQRVDVAVFTGSVNLSWQASHGGQSRVLQAGQEAMLSAGQVSIGKIGRQSRFFRATPTVSRELRIDFASTVNDPTHGHDVQAGFLPFTRPTSGATVGPQSERYYFANDPLLPVTVTVDAESGRLVWRDRGDMPTVRLGDLVEDFVTTSGEVLHLTIDGLPPGRYMMATYHHDLSGSHGTIRVSWRRGDEPRVVGCEELSITGGPLSSPAWCGFVVEAADSVPLLVEIEKIDTPHIVLNGFTLIALTEPESPAALLHEEEQPAR